MKLKLDPDQAVKEALEFRQQKQAMSAQDVFEQEQKDQQQQSKDKVEGGDYSDIVKEIDFIKEQLNKLSSKNGTLSRKELDSITHDINVTLGTVGKIDVEINEILKSRESFFELIEKDKLHNHFDELVNHYFGMVIICYETLNRTHTIHVNLRSEIEQLQSKIRNLDSD